MFRKLLILLVLTCVLVISLAACGGDAAPPVDNPAPDSGAAGSTGSDGAANPADSQPDPGESAQEQAAASPTPALAALVNGQPVTLANYESELRRQQARLAEAGVIPADEAAFRASVLTNIIDQMLIEQAAALQNLSVTDEEVQAEITLQIELAGSEDAWRAFLEDNLYTEEEYYASIRSSLLTAKIRDEVIASVPEAVPQVHARHILVATAEQADSLYQQLQQGADFAALAFEHSRDVSTRETGGDLGWFAREQLTEPVVAQVAFQLEPGAISEPVASRLGYHLIQTLESLEARPLDDLARATLFEITFDRWRQSLWTQADVQRMIQ